MLDYLCYCDSYCEQLGACTHTCCCYCCYCGGGGGYECASCWRCSVLPLLVGLSPWAASQRWQATAARTSRRSAARPRHPSSPARGSAGPWPRARARACAVATPSASWRATAARTSPSTAPAPPPALLVRKRCSLAAVPRTAHLLTTPPCAQHELCMERHAPWLQATDAARASERMRNRRLHTSMRAKVAPVVVK